MHIPSRVGGHRVRDHRGPQHSLVLSDRRDSFEKQQAKILKEQVERVLKRIEKSNGLNRNCSRQSLRYNMNRMAVKVGPSLNSSFIMSLIQKCSLISEWALVSCLVSVLAIARYSTDNLAPSL